MATIKLVYILLFAPLLLQLLYPFLTIAAARWSGRDLPADNAAPEEKSGRRRYACIITAYKNAAIAEPLVASLLRQSLPDLEIYLVADECEGPFFDFPDRRFHLLVPESPLRLKAKSIIYAVERFRAAADYIVIFDADNLAHPGFLAEIDRYAAAGQRCIQGQRTAKNLDSTYAALDSMGEHYKNYIERYVPWLLGGSAVISGSGMAVETALYKAYLDAPEIQTGKEQWKKMLQEDKILQNFLLRRDERIAYARHAVVYDEKVDSGPAVQTQRSRWLFSYFQNLPNSLGLLFSGLWRGSWNQVYFGWVTAALPMFIQLAFAIFLTLAGFFIAPAWVFAGAAAIGIFGLTVLWALKLDGAPAPVWAAVWSLPAFVTRQALALLMMRNPNKHFKHTEHKKFISVDDVVGRDRP